MIEREDFNISIGISILIYAIIALNIAGSLFQFYLFIPSIILALLFSFTFSKYHKEIDLTLDNLFKFSMSIAVVISLLIFILSYGKDAIPKEFLNSALISVGWTMISLFCISLCSILGRNSFKKENKVFLLRIATLFFVMAFMVILSFIAGLVFSLT